MERAAAVQDVFPPSPLGGEGSGVRGDLTLEDAFIALVETSDQPGDEP
jgi:hypothetical protein